MRQQRSQSRAKRLQTGLAAEIEANGDSTLLNGKTVRALWDLAQPGRVQMFLDENEWGKPAYEVTFEGGAGILAPPYNLAAGAELTWIRTGWKAEVKAIDAPGMDDTTAAVIAIVHLIGRK